MRSDRLCTFDSILLSSVARLIHDGSSACYKAPLYNCSAPQ
jgi:hypothetical protein